jgi:hypothetical protein
MIKIEMYPEVREDQLSDETYVQMATELHTRMEQEFPWQDLLHRVELDGSVLLLTLWKERDDASDPLSDLDEIQAEWFDAQTDFIWGVEDCENEEHLSSYTVSVIR